MLMSPEGLRARQIGAGIAMAGSLGFLALTNAETERSDQVRAAVVAEPMVIPLTDCVTVAPCAESSLKPTAPVVRPPLSERASRQRPVMTRQRYMQITPPESDLKRLRFCESTDQPDINTGNGYYGAYQYDLATWKEDGGLQFARRPDLATLNEQGVVLRRTFWRSYDGGKTHRGWKPWPDCSRKLNLPSYSVPNRLR